LLIAGFIGFSQYLNYNLNNPREFLRKILIPLGISVVFLIPFILSGIVQELNYIMMLFFVLFSIISSIYNLVFRTSSPRNLGGIITHIGFAVFLMGTLLTFSNSRTISTNTSSYDLGDAKANAESLLLMRGDILYMSGFYVTYTNKVINGNLTEYQVDFMKRRNGEFYKEFTLFPSVNKNQRMGDVYNPDTKHFLMKDYYTYISFASIEPDYIVIKAIVNPYINILWAGAFLMTFGLAYSFWRRIRRKNINNT
jgi:cytochrome c-type biogenesis protein CcmF